MALNESPINIVAFRKNIQKEFADFFLKGQ